MPSQQQHQEPEKRAYATLITRSSYLAGVIVLSYTLAKQGSIYPLIVLYTDNLPAASVAALEAEGRHTNLIAKPIALLQPAENVKVNLIAERFGDTWTKLRVFELFDYDTVCYLDADMIVCKNMDAVFATALPLPGRDWLAANHACVCNLDHDVWAPADWVPENCAYTPLAHPSALSSPTPVTPSSPPTHHLLNSGMFLFHPSAQLWQKMLGFFNTTPKLGEYKFPDQDFLADFFAGSWSSVGWQFNALKTMRYWHPGMWRDGEVVCLHYIVDKPWAARVGGDGRAGYKGMDGVTHGWWWEVYGEWIEEREMMGERQLVE
ncbi:glycosyltransferase family 8 protein, partial [Saccharata proteae CBS 121410]